MPFYFDSQGHLRLRELERWPWLVHAFSTRAAGDLKEPSSRRRFVRSLDGGSLQLFTVHQIHSSIVRVAAAKPAPQLSGDSLIASEAGALVGIKTADCLPVLLADPRRRAVAAAHAGWRGVAKRVVEKTAGEMRRAFGCDPADLVAAIGPGIQKCCFEVGPEVLEEFFSQFADAAQFCHTDPPNPALTMLPRQLMTGNHALMRPMEATDPCEPGRVDLAEACRRQLVAAGVPPKQIFSAGLCTACDLKRFYSYRREKEAAGRMLAVIGVRGGS